MLLERESMKKNMASIRAITHGSKFHWFGYYDKLQFDQTQRYVLGMETDFEHRRPAPNDIIKIGMIDLLNGDNWIELGETKAWCWQAGCMLQWRPGTSSEIMWNDRESERFVCRVLFIVHVVHLLFLLAAFQTLHSISAN